MLTIVIEGEEIFNESTQEFASMPDIVVSLEHSLVSLSKWESKHEKPFLVPGGKSPEEMLDYLKAMVISPDVDPEVLTACSQRNIDEIQQYIDSKQSATTFGTMPENKVHGEIITSELIYYWMVAYNIPFECQYWHLNRLFSLIRICNVKNSPPKKMGRHEIAQRNREINEMRRKQLQTPG